MKQTIRLVIFAAMLALTVPVLTQAQTPSGPAGECTDDAKNALYTEFLANRKGKTPDTPNGNQELAYAAAKKYIALCPADESDQAKYIKKWVPSYEALSRKEQFLAAYDKKNYAEMMEVGKKVLADDPNYVRGYVLLGNIGYLASTAGNTSLNAESLQYAKKAIELLEAGKTPDDWRPYAGKEDALAWLNYSIGQTHLKTSPTEALPYLLKAARLGDLFKKNPLTYIAIEQAYENGLYAKQSEDYKQYTGKAESPEQKLALQNIYQTVDRMIDAYARAIALAGTDPKLKDNKTLWTQNLTDWYKFRNNNSQAGMDVLVAGILQKPLPDIPTPLTSLPTPATGATTPPSSPAGTTSGATVAPPATTQPVNKVTTTPKTTTPATSQATKPKPKANHRRRP
jgi:hypothetical protein